MIPTMTVNVPGVPDGDVEALVSEVLVSFTPRLIRMENAVTATTSVVMLLLLLVLMCSVVNATHILLVRGARKKELTTTMFYKRRFGEDLPEDEVQLFSQEANAEK